MKNTQKIVEDALDKNADLQIGKELNALTALCALQTFQMQKANKYIKEFAEHLGLNNAVNMSNYIVEYMFPKNTLYWDTQIYRYKRIIKSSAWLKSQGVKI